MHISDAWVSVSLITASWKPWPGVFKKAFTLRSWLPSAVLRQLGHGCRRGDGEAVPKWDLHLQDQVKRYTHFPEVNLFLGEEGHGMPPSILVIPRLWFRIVFMPWPAERRAATSCSLTALTRQLCPESHFRRPECHQQSTLNRKARIGQHLTFSCGRLQARQQIQKITSYSQWSVKISSVGKIPHGFALNVRHLSMAQS